MDAETQQRIFDPFFTTKGLGEGTGLGLSTAFGTIEQHGGWLECQSRVGEGCVFSVYLPITTQLIDVGGAVVDAAMPLGTETVLVIEDEGLVQRIVSRILMRHGYSALLASNGLEGLNIFRQQREEIDLVLLDLSMPGMSGREVLGYLRTIDPEVKVVVHSGYAVDSLAEHQPQAILQKPIVPDELLRTIRVVVDGAC
jgi:CheY-like chemotaxis protein